MFPFANVRLLRVHSRRYKVFLHDLKVHRLQLTLPHFILFRHLTAFPFPTHLTAPRACGRLDFRRSSATSVSRGALRLLSGVGRASRGAMPLGKCSLLQVPNSHDLRAAYHHQLLARTFLSLCHQPPTWSGLCLRPVASSPAPHHALSPHAVFHGSEPPQ